MTKVNHKQSPLHVAARVASYKRAVSARINGSHKTCARCKTEKPVSDFAKRGGKKHGHLTKSWCIACEADAQREYHAEQKNQDPEAYARRCSRHALWVEHSIRQADYDRLLAEQGGGCAICGGQQKRGHKRFCVDHCHRTGKIRGLLCHNCNRAVGLLADDVAFLKRAISYLESTDTGLISVSRRRSAQKETFQN